MEQRQWQSVEIPLSAFYPLEEPIESIRLFGNLRGTFYLDDVILLAQVGPTQPTAVVETHDEITPAEVSLDPNFPNPFNSGTLIRFSLAHTSDIELAIYNLAGQKVARLAQGPRPAGIYRIAWDGRDDTGRDLASGLYFYRLTAGSQLQTRKLMLLR
jgi:hypothetical protein